MSDTARLSPVNADGNTATTGEPAPAGDTGHAVPGTVRPDGAAPDPPGGARVLPPPARKPMRTVTSGLSLLGVAVVAGLVWAVVRTGTGPETVPGTAAAGHPAAGALTSGAFTYTVVGGPVRSTDCAGNSYGKVVEWFTEHSCDSVARGLYTTTVDDTRALVSVVLVTMPDAELAGQLKAVTDTNNTGNVRDLVRDGTVQLPQAPNVALGEYHSDVRNNAVTIVETAFYGEHTDPALLERISEDALRLAGLLPD